MRHLSHSTFAILETSIKNMQKTYDCLVVLSLLVSFMSNSSITKVTFDASIADS